MTPGFSPAPRTPALPGFVVYGAFFAWDSGEKCDPTPCRPFQQPSRQGTGMPSLLPFERVQMNSLGLPSPPIVFKSGKLFERVQMSRRGVPASLIFTTMSLFERVQMNSLGLPSPPLIFRSGEVFERVQMRGRPAPSRASKFPLRGRPSRHPTSEGRCAMGLT